ncbi:flagellar basal body P-ring formation chaperone FlgA [Rubrivivax sp. JA1029]|uniref:flagellar basal body P-ring formation chaperone FlgA n=1 Tax=Rubrivivax sp. JA1029 TaxID=2894193 RepID=UPI001E35D54D|nr:flagellar basal body P-ring formation chaperone FlgA [Rubrivivax sp. JA1029]MCC9647439.1 flagellar basal body P-ring formation chaperone FlgA [Rubrivivax sp. JA1029]
MGKDCPRSRGTAGALLLAAALACPGPAAADTLAPATLQAVRALARDAAAALAPAGLRVEVVPGRLDPRLRLAPCNRVEPYLPTGVRPWGRARVGLRCRDGAVPWNVFLPITVEVWGPGVVAVTALAPGTVLAPGQLALGEVDWAAAATPPLASVQALEGRTLARPLAPGQALRLDALKPREWFAAGEVVSVVARGDGYAVSTRGEALMRGVEGRLVRVRTEAGRIVTGWPTAEGRVDVAR